MTLLNPDDIHRTALLAAHDGSQPTLEAALSALAAIGVVICADTATCYDTQGQAALLTATATAVRAFGNVIVLAEAPDTTITAGPGAGQTIANFTLQQGAQLPRTGEAPWAARPWPVLLIGKDTVAPSQLTRPAAISRPMLRATWAGWVASVQPATGPANGTAGPPCILAAIAAAAVGVSEAFGSTRAAPGSDAGYRAVHLSLWDPPGNPANPGPALGHAPAAWWLVGLGHLGQAYAWVISWLTYLTPTAIELVLQDTDRTTPANHSTGVLTPPGSNGTPKTRLIAAQFDHAGLGTRIIERRLGPDLRAADSECHVALIGVDNIPSRRLTSDVGWQLAIDVGLGHGPQNFASMLLRRFPGAQRSDQVTGWASDPPDPAQIPRTPAFTDLQERHDLCGVVQLAGKAVGASFVGITAACLAIAEATRELHDGTGLDILAFDLLTIETNSAPATKPADVISLPLSNSQ